MKFVNCMLNGIIFDMDGVLVDNSSVHLEAFKIFAKGYGITLSDDALAGMYGKGNDEIMPAIVPPDLVREKGIETLGREKEAIYRRIYAPTIRTVAGLVPLLEELQQAGIPCAVGSSGPKENVDFVLDSCGIRPFFSVIIDGEMVASRKPDPDIFLLAARRLGTEPSEALVFEDSLAGIEAAHRGKMPVIALTTTYSRSELETKAQPDAVFDDFTDINIPMLETIVKAHCS